MQPPEHETGLAELISLPRGLEGANPWLGSSWCNLHTAECLERAPKGLSFLELLEGSGVAVSSCCSSHELGEVQGPPHSVGQIQDLQGGCEDLGGQGELPVRAAPREPPPVWPPGSWRLHQRSQLARGCFRSRLIRK